MREGILGEVFWSWQAVDEDGNVLDILIQQQNKAAAWKFMQKLLKKQGNRTASDGDR